MNHNQFPIHEDPNTELLGSNGLANQDRIADGTEDPLAGDVDKYVHSEETRTDEQIEHDDKYAVEPYGDDATDDYWAEHDALYADDGREKVEFTFGTGFTEIAVEDLERDYPGMSHIEVQKQVDTDYEKMLERNKYKY